MDREESTNLIHVEARRQVLSPLMNVENPESPYIGVDGEPVAKRELVEWLFRELSLRRRRFVPAAERE